MLQQQSCPTINLINAWKAKNLEPVSNIRLFIRKELYKLFNEGFHLNGITSEQLLTNF
jgi:hypothetical protein